MFEAGPFVGFIVGPYDLRLPTRVSAVTAFVAQRRKVGSAVEAAPYEVAYETTDEAVQGTHGGGVKPPSREG